MTSTLSPLKFVRLSEITFDEALAKQGIASTKEDLTGLVPHAALDGAQKVIYQSPLSAKTIYALEIVSFIPPDGYASRVWQFNRDFTAAEAAAFLASLPESPS